MRRPRIKNSKLLAALVLLFQTVNTGITPLIAHAEERDYPEEVTIEYDANNIYNVSGVYNNGKVFNTHTAPTCANYKGNKQPVFCIEPEVNIINPINPGYEKNPLPDMPDRAKLVSILWKKVGQDPDTQAVAQKIIWQAANGYTIHTMTRPDGSTVDISSIEAKINKVVQGYQKKPNFDGTTTKIQEYLFRPYSYQLVETQILIVLQSLIIVRVCQLFMIVIFLLTVMRGLAIYHMEVHEVM